VPAIAINLFFHGATINIYSSQTVYDTISAHLLNGKVYPKFLELPETNPTVKFTVIEPYKPQQIEGYSVLAVPVNHNDNAFGYQITSPDGKTVFYTGDTGADLTDCWAYISPQLLIAEVTVPDRYQGIAQETGHLTPSLLKQELVSFRELKGYLPLVVLVHMNPAQEEEIGAEIGVVAKSLNAPITLAYEGMQLHL
jgi:cAMP phosphodiesterase